MNEGASSPYGPTDTWPEWSFLVCPSAPATEDEVVDAISGDAFARRPSVRDGLIARRL